MTVNRRTAAFLVLALVFCSAGAASAGAPADVTDDSAVVTEAPALDETVEEPSEATGWRQWLPKVTAQGAFSYGYDFNEPDRNATNAQEGLYSGMDKADAFNVDLLQIAVTGIFPYGGYRLKVDTGDLARVVSDAGTANRNIVFYDGGGQWEVVLQEGFLYFEPGPVTISIGRVPSPIGYEVVEPWANAHITRSRAWYEQPISFDGVTISGSAYNVDAMIGYVNSYFRDDEYDRFDEQLDNPGEVDEAVTTYWDDVRHSKHESGLIYKLGTRLYDTDLSIAGFYGKKDQASISMRKNNPLDNSLTVAEKPADQVLFNFVASHSFQFVNLAAEFNYGHIDGVDSFVFYGFDKNVSLIDAGTRCTENDTDCSGEVINGTLYAGVPFLEKGSFNLRTDYGSYQTPSRFKETTQWSVTTTLIWQFTDMIGARFEYRYDGSNNESNDILLDTFEEDDHDADSAHTIHLQAVLGLSSK